MSGSWSTEETTTLISIWGEESVQSRLDSAHRNRHIFEQIARDMSENGYEKTWQQCRTKMKNLIQKYRKVLNRIILGFCILLVMSTDQRPQQHFREQQGKLELF